MQPWLSFAHLFIGMGGYAACSPKIYRINTFVHEPMS
jgi:hypothetical protein